MITATVTSYSVGDAYSPSHGITASGEHVRPYWTLAADWTCYRPGAWIYLQGLGVRQVTDRGGAIVGCNRLDVYMVERVNALRWGRRHVRVRLVGWTPPGVPLDDMEAW